MTHQLISGRGFSSFVCQFFDIFDDFSYRQRLCIFGVMSLKMTSFRVTCDKLILHVLDKLVTLKLIIFKLVTPKIQDHGHLLAGQGTRYTGAKKWKNSAIPIMCDFVF